MDVSTKDMMIDGSIYERDFTANLKEVVDQCQWKTDDKSVRLSTGSEICFDHGTEAATISLECAITPLGLMDSTKSQQHTNDKSTDICLVSHLHLNVSAGRQRSNYTLYIYIYIYKPKYYVKAR